MEKLKSSIILVLVLLLVGYVGYNHFFGPVADTATPDEHQKILDSIRTKYAEKLIEFNFQYDSLLYLKQDQDTAVRGLKIQAEHYKAAAIKNADTAKKYVKLYYKAKAELDTTTMLVTCDELAASYSLLYDDFRQYTVYADSLVITLDSSLTIRDSMITTLQVKDSVRAQAVLDCSTNYQHLINDYSKLSSRKRKGAWVDRGIAFFLGMFVGGFRK